MSNQSLTDNSTTETAANKVQVHADISWDGFIGKYKPQKVNVSVDNNFTDYVYRASDDEVQAMLKSDPSRVWTYFCNGDGMQWVGNGYHVVDREGYVITEVGCADDMTVAVHDDAWSAYSKLVFVCDPNVDIDELYETVSERAINVDDLGSRCIDFPCEIRVTSQEEIVKQSHHCLVIELDVMFEDNEPTKEQLAELHDAMKDLCESIRSKTEGISVALHEEGPVSLVWTGITDKSTKFLTCDVCGHTNQNHDWIDEGETCPKCKTIN